MSLEDIIFKILIPLLAACIGAIIAFRYQHTIELKREKRIIIQALMMYRNVGALENDWIKALNAVDIVFNKDQRVRELYHTFLAQTRRPIFENQQWIETFYQMIHEMAQQTEYKHLTMHDIRDFYSPEALSRHYPNMNVVSEPSAPVPIDVKPTN